ncbi:MAG: hypothetical protein R6X06_11640 [Gammaproteobacteria bacterium]
MTKKSIIAMFISAGLLASSAAYADHNSVWGAGSANMPNDIHNTRIEDDNDTFLELVQQGGGADSVNRYTDTDSTATTMGSSSLMGGSMGSRSMTVTRGGRR